MTLDRHDRPDPAQREIALPPAALEVVRPGWFVPVSGDAERAHWYDLDPPAAARRAAIPPMRRLCDAERFHPADLLEPGAWRSCRRCRAMINRAGRASP